MEVSDSLRRDIHSELLHGPLPSEAELQSRFGVSRSVVRQALATLEAEGLVQKVCGKGSTGIHGKGYPLTLACRAL